MKSGTDEGDDPGATRLMSLVKAVEQLSAADTMHGIIEIVRNTARAISGADGVTFVLRDGDQCHYVEEDSIGPLWKGRRFPLATCISGWCMLNDQAAVIPDIYLDARIPHDAYRPTFVKSLVMVPVRAKAPIAAIGSYWSRVREFDASEVALLEALARSTAAAIIAVRARDTLRESEARLLLALAAGSLGAWELDLADGTLTTSPVAKANFGRAPEDGFTYQDMVEAVHPEDRRRHHEAIARTTNTQTDLDIEYRIVWPDGSERWIEMRGRAVLDVNSKPTRLTGVSLDITGRRQAKERQERLQSELAHVGRLNEMGQMVSAFAHELNQPLAAANNYLRAAMRYHDSDAASPKVGELITKADAQITRVADIIKRIRGFAAKTESTETTEEIALLISEAAELALLDPRHRGVELRLAVEELLPAVRVDKVQVVQVLLNLFRNAFEAMEGQPLRRVTVSTRRAGDMVEISVADTGPGLAPEVAAKLFQPFVTTKESGMGVGLSICRTLVESHGGKLWAEEGTGHGADFRFTVPVAK